MNKKNLLIILVVLGILVFGIVKENISYKMNYYTTDRQVIHENTVPEGE